jgi:pimeloyl-ACP methyl ester carboxylesterase
MPGPGGWKKRGGARACRYWSAEMAADKHAPRSGFAEVNGARLFYEIAGAGPALALIHGFGLDARMWDDQFAVFAQRYRVLRYDARGFGRSAVPASEPYSHAEDLRALLEHLAIGQTALVGFSLGGGIALSFALEHPAATDALIVAGSVLPGMRWSAELAASFGAVWSAGRAQGVAAARERWLQHPLFAPILGRPGPGARFTQMVSDYSGWEWTHRDPQRDPEPPPAQRLSEIRAPSLAIVGARDLPDFHAVAGMIQRGIPGARGMVVPGAGHVVSMEAPERFNQLAIDFLSACARP